MYFLLLYIRPQELGLISLIFHWNVLTQLRHNQSSCRRGVVYGGSHTRHCPTGSSLTKMAMSEWSTSRGQGAVAASAVFTSLATILAGIRVYTRAFIVKKIGIDDWIVLVAVVSSLHRWPHLIYTHTCLGLFMGILRPFCWRFVTSSIPP